MASEYPEEPVLELIADPGRTSHLLRQRSRSPMVTERDFDPATTDRV
jgi:hypothetical protein